MSQEKLPEEKPPPIPPRPPVCPNDGTRLKEAVILDRPMLSCPYCGASFSPESLKYLQFDPTRLRG